MWFFTGKGDSGTTYLFDRSKVKKDNPILELLGVIDEVCAYIGLAISSIKSIEIKNDLHEIQITLSRIMGIIAGVSESSNNKFDFQESIKWLEERIIFYGRDLDKPINFSFTGKTVTGAMFDICRTISRKMERRAVAILHENQQNRKNILIYFNRLSSFFYVVRLFVDK